MNGYILTPITNTNGWVVYENDISLDYKEFFKGELLPSEELPLFYDIPKSSNLKKIKKALFEAGLKGLQFSNSIDITPKDRTIYERI